MRPKIIFFHPASNSAGKCILPMSLLALATLLENTYEYIIVDANAERDPLRALDELIGVRGYNVLATTVMPGPQLAQAVPIARELKQRYPHLINIWGGYFPTQHTDTVLNSDYIDFAIRSQGERTFIELLRALERGGDLAAIRGLSFKCGRAIVHNPLRELVSPENFPAFPYQRIDMPRYLNRNYMGTRVTEHHSSFGCPFACNFCAVVAMSNRRWLAQSPARLESTLRTLRDEYGADAVNFHDMDFFVSEARVAEFAERIRDFGMRWWGLGRIDTLMNYKETTWEKMRASGLKMIFSGAESGSDDVLKLMNKGGKASTHATLEFAKRARAYGIVPEFSFVLGNPPDPRADIDASIRFIREIKRVNPATEFILYLYTPVALDGALYDNALQSGFQFPESLDEWTTPFWREFATRREGRTPWIDRDTQRTVRDFERVLNAYYPTITDTRLVGLRRATLHALAAWRYRAQVYAAPYELRALQRVWRYQRPETSGF
ncbi:MAG: B12-binding domain-containing radical SAM protein [Chloroflexi bacterium]|nr:B12-binding domain-containing radical SAM protein [Chloroflexota bacterium]